jgi:aryl-alcohol dehydrogenase-like predicted oxidoreductase
MLPVNDLGSTGIQVTRLGFGTLTMSPMQRGLDIKAGGDLLRAGLEAGIRFVDTAQMYGSYPQVRHGLAGWQGSPITVASKSAAATAEAMTAAVEECRQALDRDRIEVFLLHAVRDEADLVRRAPAIEVLLAARSRGWIGAIGASSHATPTMRVLAADPRLEVLHPMVNQQGIGLRDGSLEQMIEVLRVARHHGKGVYAMKPLGGGHLRAEAADALRWVLGHELLDAAAVGMTTVGELEMNLLVARGEMPSAELVARVRGQARRLFINGSLCRSCGTCRARCPQDAISLNAAGKAVVDEALCVLCGYCAPVCPGFAIRII